MFMPNIRGVPRYCGGLTFTYNKQRVMPVSANLNTVMLEAVRRSDCASKPYIVPNSLADRSCYDKVHSIQQLEGGVSVVHREDTTTSTTFGEDMEALDSFFNEREVSVDDLPAIKLCESDGIEQKFTHVEYVYDRQYNTVKKGRRDDALYKCMTPSQMIRINYDVSNDANVSLSMSAKEHMKGWNNDELNTKRTIYFGETLVKVIQPALMFHYYLWKFARPVTNLPDDVTCHVKSQGDFTHFVILGDMSHKLFFTNMSLTKTLFGCRALFFNMGTCNIINPNYPHEANIISIVQQTYTDIEDYI